MCVFCTGQTSTIDDHIAYKPFIIRVGDLPVEIHSVSYRQSQHLHQINQIKLCSCINTIEQVGARSRLLLSYDWPITVQGCSLVVNYVTARTRGI